MIDLNLIGDRLEELVTALFPGETVYRDLVPVNFARPSTLIVLDRADFDLDFSCGTVELLPVFMLTAFVPVDERHHSHLASLHSRAMALLNLFLPGYIEVGDRAVKVVSPAKLDAGYDYDTILVTLSCTVDREDLESINSQLPTMEQLHLRSETK